MGWYVDGQGYVLLPQVAFETRRLPQCLLHIHVRHGQLKATGVRQGRLPQVLHQARKEEVIAYEHLERFGVELHYPVLQCFQVDALGRQGRP